MTISRKVQNNRFLSNKGILTVFILSVFPVFLFDQCSADITPLTAFSTDGHTIYHIKPVKIKKTEPNALVMAAYDGAVLCYTPDGKLLWENNDNKDFPFDLAVADIDNDGLDETFIATAGGVINALAADGTLLWSYKREAPLYQVCPLKTASGEWVIFTGGIEEEIYALTAKGSLKGSFEAGDVVRHIRKGDILGDGREYAAVLTASSGLTGNLTLMLFDPATLKPIWCKPNLGPKKGWKRFFSMAIFDLNHDGRQDIVMSHYGGNGKIFGYDFEGNQILESSDPMVPSISYRMNLLARVNLKDNTDEYIFGLYANYLIIYDKNGKIQKLLKNKYDFGACAFDPETNTYYIGSSTSGGDGIYALHLDKPGWEKAFEELRPVGRLAEVEKNISSLKAQVEKFKIPDYQKIPTKVTITAEKPDGKSYDNINFTSLLRISEKNDRSELWCREIDTRLAYDKTSDEILKLVKDREARGEDFIVVAGHADAFYMSPATLEKIIAAAPKHLHGFLFGEMSTVDKNMEEVVVKLLLPLAEQCSESGKKIILANKFVFWNGACYVDFWKRVLLNPRFSDVFIPTLEESNSRTQELSLAGRVGLWMTDSFDHWSSRAIMDNGGFNRMWEWSSQQVLSHYIRQLAFQASMGADNFMINILQGPLAPDLWKQMLPFYEMMEKGVIAIPEHNELLSVSDLCLGMKNPSQEYLVHGINGHQYNFNEVKRPPMLFDRLDCYWGAAPLEDYDFSSYGYGCERRMFNFLPKNPYGLIAIVPDDIDIAKFQRFRDKVSIDGQYFYDQTGKQHGPAEYKQVMLEKLKESATHLPVLVKGDVAWSVVRLDPNHVRVTIVDPGYIIPADRDAEIILQHLNGTECIDILSGEKLEIKGEKIQLRVPAGIFRVIDIKH